MDDVRTGPAPGPPRGAGAAPGPGRSPRRPAVVLVVVLGVLIVASAAAYLVVNGGFGSPAAGADLEGEWAGTGTVAACEGRICPPGEEIGLSVECSWSTCTVEVGDQRAELEAGEGDRVTAAGSVPPQHLPPCSGGGFATGRWSLELDPDGDALTGRYTEETTSSCGPVVSRSVSTTRVAWDLRVIRA
ncbi:hypothetical protein [Blastococcus sp. SYSU D00813]